MHNKLIAALVKAGLIEADATLGEATAVLKAWCKQGNHTLPDDLNDESAIEPLLKALTGDGNPAPATAGNPTDPNPANTPAANAAVSYRDMVAMVRTASLSADAQVELIAELAEENLSVAQILDKINARATDANQPAGANADSVTVTDDARDKFEAAARDAILLGTLQGERPEQIYDYRADNYVDWNPERRNYGLGSPLNIARQCLITGGYPVQQVLGLAPMQVAKLVMGADPRQLGLGGLLAAADGAAYNVSGMFSNILLDARNVSLRRSYDEANTTYQIWMGRGPDIPDFKTVHRVIAGELNDPTAVPEDGTFDETTLSDGKESYKLTVWGRLLSRSWQLIVNDQLGGFNDVEMKMGGAMRRKVNRLAYQELKDNAALSDGTNLFAAGHSNNTTGAVSNYGTAFSTMVQKMREQKGLDSDSHILNLSPEYVLFPPALRPSILKELRSEAPPSESHAGVSNIHRGAYTPVEEGELSAASTGGSDTGFYMAAGPQQVDTVEYAFLQGLPAPVIEQEMAFDRLAVKSRNTTSRSA